MENQVNFDEVVTKNPKTIAVIGTGYVGLPSSAVFNKWGNKVYAVDVDKKKIDDLNNGIMPIYEEHVEDFIKEGLQKGTFKATLDYKEAVEDSDIIIIAVGTPGTAIGTADMRYIDASARSIGENIPEGTHKIIVTKSTVPVGTSERVKKAVLEGANGRNISFSVASNPEFLREGFAVIDSYITDRVVIGVEDEKTGKVLSSLFEHIDTEIFLTDIKSSELIKYASNTFLATKITFVNELASLCQRVGADVKNVARGMGLDQRIGTRFLNPTEIGFGGPCFPKDVDALYHMSLGANYDFQILASVISVNEKLQRVFVNKIARKFGSNLTGKTLGILGTAFKDNTDDARHSPAVEVIRILRGMGAELKIYDPLAIETARQQLGENNILYASSHKEVFSGVDAVVILTEWKEFLDYDYKGLSENMNSKVIFDARYMLTPSKMKEYGIEYYSSGRQ